MLVRGLLGEKVRTVRHFLGLLELQKQGLQKETTSLATSFLGADVRQRRLNALRSSAQEESASLGAAKAGLLDPTEVEELFD